MAPRKRKAEEKGEEAPKALAVAARMTRSAARLAAGGNSVDSVPEKKPKVAKKKGKGKLKVLAEENEEEEEDEKKEKDSENGDDGAKRKTIVIEHCKQCNSFKTRALQVKKGLEDGVSGITVLLNPDKPRKGCFEIREEGSGGEPFISLLEMKRPFKPMKDLDMAKVIEDIIDKIK